MASAASTRRHARIRRRGRDARRAPAEPRRRRAAGRATACMHGVHGRRRAGSGRDLLAIPPLRLRRGGGARRLAPLGARRPRLCARARMGGGAHGLDLDRPLALDGLSSRDWRRTRSSTAPPCWRLPWRICGARRRTRRPPRPHAPARDARHHRALRRSRSRGRAAPAAPLASCRRRSAARARGRPDRRFSVAGRRLRANIRAPRRRRARWPCLMIADPDRGDLSLRRPYRISRAERRAVARAARRNLREAYLERLAAHRDAMRAACRRTGWELCAASHRPVRAAGAAGAATRLEGAAAAPQAGG